MVGGEGFKPIDSITSIGYHLAFRAGGLRARSDARSAAAESGTRRMFVSPSQLAPGDSYAIKYYK